MDLIDFTYLSLLKSGKFALLSSDADQVEMYIDMQTYQDSVYITDFAKTHAGSTFATCEKQGSYKLDSWRKKLLKDFSIRTTYVLSEKNNECCNMFMWSFKDPDSRMTIEEEKHRILKNCSNVAKIMHKCMRKFKHTFFDLSKEDYMFQSYVDDFKDPDNAAKFIVQEDFNQKDKDNLLVEMGVIQESDLQLKEMSLSWHEKAFLLNLLKPGFSITDEQMYTNCMNRLECKTINDLTNKASALNHLNVL